MCTVWSRTCWSCLVHHHFLLYLCSRSRTWHFVRFSWCSSTCTFRISVILIPTFLAFRQGNDNVELSMVILVFLKCFIHYVSGLCGVSMTDAFARVCLLERLRSIDGSAWPQPFLLLKVVASHLIRVTFRLNQWLALIVWEHLVDLCLQIYFFVAGIVL